MPVPYDAQISSLESLLSSLDRARSSLPTLLQSFASVPSTATQSDRVQVYRSASNECWTSVRALGHDLLACESVLNGAEASAAVDSTGIKVKPRDTTASTGINGKNSHPASGADSWTRLYDVLAGGHSRHSPSIDRKGKTRQRDINSVYNRRFGDVSSVADLNRLVEEWCRLPAHQERVSIEIIGQRSAAGDETTTTATEEPNELRLVLKGVLQAVLMLHWSQSADEPRTRVAQVERVACFGVREQVRIRILRFSSMACADQDSYFVCLALALPQKASYLQSQFTLHNSLSRQAMDMIERGRIRTANGNMPEKSNIEEILVSQGTLGSNHVQTDQAVNASLTRLLFPCDRTSCLILRYHSDRCKSLSWTCLLAQKRTVLEMGCASASVVII